MFSLASMVENDQDESFCLQHNMYKASPIP